MVMCKLWNMFGACRSYFGEKDWQQLVMFKRLADDLCWPVEVIGCPTIRDDDGVAVSSRNAQLTTDQRAVAPVLYRALCDCRDAALAGTTHGGRARAGVRSTPSASPARPVLHRRRGRRCSRSSRSPARCGCSASIELGTVRLLDNVGVELAGGLSRVAARPELRRRHLRGDARRHRGIRRFARDRRHDRGAGRHEQGNHLPSLGLARATHPRRGRRRWKGRTSKHPAIPCARTSRSCSRTSSTTSTRHDICRIFPSLIDAAVRDPNSRSSTERGCGEARAGFEEIVRRGVERGDLPADVDIGLFVDVIRAPFIYRRVVAQLPVERDDIDAVLDLVLGAFSRVPD